MAVKTWTGATDSDVTTAANWSPSGQPTAGDDVIITGSVGITGATLSASGNLASFVIRDYSGALGSEDAPLVVDLAASGKASVDTTGKAYLDFNASDTDVDVYRTQASEGTARGLHLSGEGLNHLNAYGTSSILLLETLDNNINTFGNGVQITTETSADAVTFNGPGTLTAYGELTNIYTNGGIVDYYGGTTTVTKVQAENGGRINFWAEANITTANAYGGTIDLKDIPSSHTVTTADLSGAGGLIFGRNWTPTNLPSGNYQLTSA